MSYDDWKTTEPDPNEFDLKPGESDCWSCGAAPDEPCEQECICASCERARKRNEPGEAA